MHDTRVKRNGSTESKYDKKGYADLGGIRDIGPGRRGSLAVNQVNDIKFKAVKRGFEWALSHEEAFDMIKAACTYCGDDPKWPTARSGIDRVENGKGYFLDNCVPCCKYCNSAKQDRTLEEFISWIKRVHARIVENETTIDASKTS
jgi:hypothetical protein